MKKRFFSAALAGCMMLTMIPVSAFAAGEGATEVAIEQYAADATLTEIGIEALDRQLLDDANPGMKLGDFRNNDGKLKPMYGYKGVNSANPATNCGEASQQSGYFLPLKLLVPGANAKTRVIVEEYALSVSGNASSTLTKKEYTDSLFTEWSTTDHSGHKDVGCLVVQVARLDGTYLRPDSVKVKVDLNGDGKEETTKELSFPMSKVSLADSEFKNLKEDMEICTDGSKKFGTVSGNGEIQKRAVDLYDAKKQIVNKVDDFTAYAGSGYGLEAGYYLPFSFKVDNPDAVIVGRAVMANGTIVDLFETDVNGLLTVTNKEVSFVQRIAGLDGKKLYDKIIVDVYPEGVRPQGTNSDGALTKRLTFDVSSVVLDRDVVSKTVRIPKANEVTEDASDFEFDDEFFHHYAHTVDFLAYRNNIAAVKSIALNAKGDLLTVTADLSVLNSSQSFSCYLPVLFSLTKDGAAVASKQLGVANFGGTVGTNYVAFVNLRANNDNHPYVYVYDNSGTAYKVEYKILSASKVPVLTDSTVKSENGKLTGLTAAAAAKTAADVKAMYTLNGGTVTILNAAGKTLKDTDAVGTGCVIVLKDAEQDEVERITVVVKGDVLGEGRVHLGQLVAAAKAVNGTEPLEDEYLLAGDINGNGKMELGDLVGIAALMK